MNEAFKTLNKYKDKLTRQQYKTFKGQILHKDIAGFEKGLNRLMIRRCKNWQGRDNQ